MYVCTTNYIHSFTYIYLQSKMIGKLTFPHAEQRNENHVSLHRKKSTQNAIDLIVTPETIKLLQEKI